MCVRAVILRVVRSNVSVFVCLYMFVCLYVCTIHAGVWMPARMVVRPGVAACRYVSVHACECVRDVHTIECGQWRSENVMVATYSCRRSRELC